MFCLFLNFCPVFYSPGTQSRWKICNYLCVSVKSTIICRHPTHIGLYGQSHRVQLWKKKRGNCTSVYIVLTIFSFYIHPSLNKHRLYEPSAAAEGSDVLTGWHRWPAALHGQTSELTETAGISERDVTAPTTLPEFGSRSFTFLVGFEPLLYFLESEVSETTEHSSNALNTSAIIGYVGSGVILAVTVIPVLEQLVFNLFGLVGLWYEFYCSSDGVHNEGVDSTR